MMELDKKEKPYMNSSI